MLANKEKQCIKNKRRYVKLMSIRIEQQQQEAKKQQEIFEKRREKEQAKEKVRNTINTQVITKENQVHFVMYRHGFSKRNQQDIEAMEKLIIAFLLICHSHYFTRYIIIMTYHTYNIILFQFVCVCVHACVLVLVSGSIHYITTSLQIVAMENELKKSGKLNNIQEVKAFWDEMLAPPTTTVESSYKHGKTYCS